MKKILVQQCNAAIVHSMSKPTLSTVFQSCQEADGVADDGADWMGAMSALSSLNALSSDDEADEAGEGEIPEVGVVRHTVTPCEGIVVQKRYSGSKKTFRSNND